MKNYRQSYLKKWDEQVNCHKRKYFVEKYFIQNSREIFSLKGFLGSMKEDLLFIARQIYSVAKQVKVFGPIIRKEYGMPLYVQCYKLLYLTLIVRKNAQEFRKRLLFKTGSWKNVKRYDYGQTHTQIHLATRSFPGEIPVIDDKLRFYRYCKKKKIRTPEIIAVFSGGRQIYPTNTSFDLPFEDLFIKDRMGGRGVNAKKFMYHQNLYKDSDQKKYTKQELLKFIINYSHRCDLIIQKRVVNHALFKPFTSGALSTCRIVTVKSRDESCVNPLFAVLRMPCGNRDVDNYAQGGLISTIDISTGVLGRAVTYLPYQELFEFDKHPDSNQQITGTKLPMWNEILKFTIESHKNFSSLAVGWDVCAADDGFYLVEGNIRWGSTLYESPEQIPFRNTLYPVVYGELMAKYSRHA